MDCKPFYVFILLSFGHGTFERYFGWNNPSIFSFACSTRFILYTEHPVALQNSLHSGKFLWGKFWDNVVWNTIRSLPVYSGGRRTVWNLNKLWMLRRFFQILNKSSSTRREYRDELERELSIESPVRPSLCEGGGGEVEVRRNISAFLGEYLSQSANW